MDNDDALVGRIYSRREALLAATRAGFGLALTGGISQVWAWSDRRILAPSVHLVASPELTEGPFFVEEHLNRSNLIGTTDRVSVTGGIPLALSFTVYELKGSEFRPLEGAHVDVWHADAHGRYSDESNPMNGEDTSSQKWLRGYQVSSSTGIASFQTILPGWYESRTAHIHFKVRHYSATGRVTSTFNSQLFFKDELMDVLYAQSPYAGRGQRQTRNRTDNIFCESQPDGTVAGDHLTLNLEKDSASKGYRAHYAIALSAPKGPTSFGPFDGGFPPVGKG